MNSRSPLNAAIPKPVVVASMSMKNESCISANSVPDASIEKCSASSRNSQRSNLKSAGRGWRSLREEQAPERWRITRKKSLFWWPRTRKAWVLVPTKSSLQAHLRAKQWSCQSIAVKNQEDRTPNAVRNPSKSKSSEQRSKTRSWSIVSCSSNLLRTTWTSSKLREWSRGSATIREKTLWRSF